jgi:hypothetical protein
MVNIMIDKTKHYFAKLAPIDYILPWGWAMTSHGNETWCECEIVEDRYKLSDGYKVTLKPLSQGFGWEHYYQSDFESSLRSGHIIEKTRDNQHVEYVEWYEMITPTVPVRYSGYVVV